jgi:L-seryl-tRNA(Ser) seleniumtransferase
VTLPDRRRQLPALDALLQSAAGAALRRRCGHELAVDGLRAALDEFRQRLENGNEPVPGIADLVDRAESWVSARLRPTLQPVINATGVIIHTNLGRAPLSAAARMAVGEAAGGYSSLEFNLATGGRGSRSVHAAELLCRLTGAEAALVVNNTAAAMVLMLTALCRQRDVIISRGQLVEIGGGFRVPDILAQSGARLVEVGTTNRTHFYDYERALTADTAAILVAHHSNFKIIGFTAEPPLRELAELAHARGVPLLYDQGSGALRDTGRFGLEPEPTVQAGVAAGADLIAFSGDKLLGGPQAGVIVGRQALIDQLRAHPLARAVRPDKLCLAGLSATLQHYVVGEELAQVPVWRMMALTADEIANTAAAWAAALRAVGVDANTEPGHSTVGGGSLPGQTLATTLVAVAGADLDQSASALRAHQPSIIARVGNDRLLIDPRTVLPGQDETLLHALVEILSPG